jgi:chromate reductase
LQEEAMSQYQVAVIVGSLRRDSINRKLATGVIRLAPPEFTFRIIEIGDLPLYNADEEANPPASVTRFRGEVAGSQALLFVTPEYNRSIPGVLKNALDQGSRPVGHSVWAGKPGGVMGMSPGPISTAVAQQHLRNILVTLDVAAMAQPEVFIQYKEGLFDEAGNIGAASKAFLQKWMDRYVTWVKRLVG